jgi:hypothetical protein
MINLFKENMWKQFGASIDMLKNAIALWPEESWNTNKKFFYNAYHCLIFLDYYLTVPPKKFSSPLSFTISESGEVPEDGIDDLIPGRIYSKKELLDYLESNRNKCRTLIGGLTEEKLKERWIEEEESGMNYSVLEILLYNMRHVQHHAAQLNLLLRQGINDAPGWVSRAEDDL